jgi:hypothetical protein
MGEKVDRLQPVGYCDCVYKLRDNECCPYLCPLCDAQFAHSALPGGITNSILFCLRCCGFTNLTMSLSWFEEIECSHGEFGWSRSHLPTESSFFQLTNAHKNGMNLIEAVVVIAADGSFRTDTAARYALRESKLKLLLQANLLPPEGSSEPEFFHCSQSHSLKPSILDTAHKFNATATSNRSSRLRSLSRAPARSDGMDELSAYVRRYRLWAYIELLCVSQ